MTVAKVNPQEAVALHRKGRHILSIAAHFGCKPPAIYAAFRRAGYIIPTMKEARAARPARIEDHLFPPGNAGPDQWTRAQAKREEMDARPRAPEREPCLRCGVRADIGCRHSKAPLGQRFG